MNVKPALACWIVWLVCPFAVATVSAQQDQRFDIFKRSRNLHGVALPEMAVDLSAPLNGVVWELHVAEGDDVKKGDILLVIDNRAAMESYRSAEIVARGEAMLRHAASELKLAHSNLGRLHRAVEQGAANEYELAELKIRYEQAHARYDAEKERRDQALQTLAAEEVNLELHNLRAPFDGTIIRVEIRQGASAFTTEPIISVASLKVLRVELHLPLNRFGELQTGKEYELIAGPPVSDRLRGKLISVDPIIDSATESFRCVFLIDNADESLPAGFTVELGPAGE